MTRLGEFGYRLILMAFPVAFRERHGQAMLEQFGSQREALRGRPFAVVGLWVRAILDGVRHGIGERIESRQRQLRVSRDASPFARREGRTGGQWAADLRYALRSLRRQPAFTLTAVATLTLGIGANAAVFALAWHTSFRPLPYPDPDRLIRIFESSAAQPLAEVSPASLLAWVQRAKSIESIGDFGRSRVIFPLDDNGELARYQSLSPGVFAALGVQPILGRTVVTDAERQSDEVLISFEYWQRRFGGDTGVINRLHHFADVADSPERIIGVMPPGFKFLDEADIWAVNPSHPRGPIGARFRSVRQYTPVARVRPGHTIAEATAELAQISADLSKEFPDTHAGWMPRVLTLHESVVGKFGLMATLLVGASAAVFLIACTNVAGLLVMRAAGRKHEVQLRLALGGSRWRIVRLWLFEGLAVSTVSLAAGILVARWLTRALSAAAPASLPRLEQVTISWPTIVVGATGALGFIIVYALAPLAAGVLGSKGTMLLGASASRTVAGGGRGRGLLLGAQATLAAVLLTGTVLLTSSLQQLRDEPLGFDPSGVVAVRLSPHYPGTRRPWAQSAEYGRLLEERLKAHPAVVDAGVSTAVPLDDHAEPSLYTVPGDPSERRWGAIELAASPGFASTLGLSLTEGRWFTDSDAFSADVLTTSDKSDQVAVITESMARSIWPGESPLGKRLISVAGDPHPKRIVGVVRDLKFYGANEVPTFRMFLPWRQRPGAGTLALLVKTTGDPRALAADVGTIARQLRPNTGVQPARSLDDLYRASSADTGFAATLVGGFSALAVLLTGVGVFGLVGYSIAARRRELAVRMALGAGRGRISAVAAAAGFMPVLIGTGIGLVAALSCVRYVRGLLFEVNPLSPAHYVIAGAVLLTVAAAASAAPLRRLLKIDPAESLRSE
jgi:putative ABC transport system permease protein